MGLDGLNILLEMHERVDEWMGGRHEWYMEIHLSTGYTVAVPAYVFWIYCTYFDSDMQNVF